MSGRQPDASTLRGAKRILMKMIDGAAISTFFSHPDRSSLPVVGTFAVALAMSAFFQIALALKPLGTATPRYY